MADSERIGITGLHNFHFFVRDAQRAHRFYTEVLGWTPTWQSSAHMTEATGQHSVAYQGGDVTVLVSTPRDERCRAARYLRRHPEGVGSLSFEVADIDAAWSFLLERGATPIHDIRRTRVGDGFFAHFSITTALGDVSFRFLERRDYDGFAPGFERFDGEAKAATNPFQYGGIDHITSNAVTLMPVVLWMKHVLGMEKYWEIAFHTDDVKKGRATGTGLKSVVMWDPRSGLKFPVNEPLAPFFVQGQINVFVEDNWGAGIQHVAVRVDDILTAVRTLRARGVEFLHTPHTYYEATPARLAAKGVDVEALAHSLHDLEQLGILIDGKPTDRYLLQIFMKDFQTWYGESQAGPFFYELIERFGDNGFGEGNFRALFEAIERAQLGEESQP